MVAVINGMRGLRGSGIGGIMPSELVASSGKGVASGGSIHRKVESADAIAAVDARQIVGIGAGGVVRSVLI